MSLWKHNYEMLCTLWHSTKGFAATYASPLVMCLVFAQVSDRAIIVYGLLLPYLLLGFAIAEGTEMAIFYLIGRQSQTNIVALFAWQASLALMYYAGGFLYQPGGVTTFEMTLIARPLFIMAALSIASAGCIGILRARGAFRRIYRANFAFLCITIGMAIWCALHDLLDTSTWAHTMAYVAVLESIVWFLLLQPWHRALWRCTLQGHSLHLYSRFSIPLILSWSVVALDRHWLNGIVGQWDTAYVGVFAGWFQLKPFFLIPALALGQVLAQRRQHDHAMFHWSHIRPISPALFLWIGMTVFLAYRVFTHVEQILSLCTPHLEDAVHALTIVIWTDAALIPFMGGMHVSRYLLESDQKGYVVAAIFAAAMIVARGFLQLTAHHASMPLLITSFLLHAAIVMMIPIYLGLRLTHNRVFLAHATTAAH